MEILTILLPFLTPIFSKLFEKCGAPASGQNDDPKAEIMANRNVDGSFKEQFVRRMRPHTRRAMRRANRGKHRSDPSFVQVGNEAADQQTVKFFQHVLNAPDKAVATGFASGKIDFIGSDDDMAGV